ncbi:MAG: hypothetical protein JSS09_03570, partial [Verrucomicrobia bacterium]|nr:hypothetical protein [Verrucomicrobiota bacterium]
MNTSMLNCCLCNPSLDPLVGDDLCELCYTKILDNNPLNGNAKTSKVFNSAQVCFTCNMNSMKLQKDALTGRFVCLTCLNSSLILDALFVEEFALSRICFTCSATSTSQWYKTKDKTQDLCHRCYSSERSNLAKSGAIEKTCSTCSETSTSQWLKTKDKTQDLCRRCYALEKSNLAKSGAMGKTCSICSATTTPEWSKTKDKQDLCHRCYKLERRTLAKSGAMGKTCSICFATATNE